MWRSLCIRALAAGAKRIARRSLPTGSTRRKGFPTGSCGGNVEECAEVCRKSRYSTVLWRSQGGARRTPTQDKSKKFSHPGGRSTAVVHSTTTTLGYRISLKLVGVGEEGAGRDSRVAGGSATDALVDRRGPTVCPQICPGGSKARPAALGAGRTEFRGALPSASRASRSVPLGRHADAPAVRLAGGVFQRSGIRRRWIELGAGVPSP